MTDKQTTIDCKYKIHKSELWEGKPHCSLFNELCEDLSFICDNNCQVYEDYKQLEQLKTENLGLKILHESDKDLLKSNEEKIKNLKSYNLQEVGQLKFAIGTLTAENLHLKELLDMRIEAICDSCMAGSMLPINCRIYKQRLLNIKQILTEGVCKNCSEDSANDCIPECDSHRILEIIKEVEDEQE